MGVLSVGEENGLPMSIVTETDRVRHQAVTKVIHCSEAQWQQNGDAIQITKPDKWLEHADSIIIWWDEMEPRTMISKNLY